MTASATGCEPADAGDLDTLVDVYVPAFFDDPVFGWVFPDPARRAEGLRGFFGTVAASTFAGGGSALQADDFAAVSMFYPPDAPTPTDADQREFRDRLARSLGDQADRALAVMALLETHHPHDLPPHYYVTFLAALPGHQGRGLGTRLQKAVFALADASGAGTYKEASSPRNLALYERLGHRRHGPEIRVPDGPPIWPILRPAHPRPALR